MNKESTKANAPHYKLFIDGEFVLSLLEQEIEVRNPADESIVGYAALATEQDAERAVQAARASFESGVWSRASPHVRAKTLENLADLLEKHSEEFTRLLMLETGSTIGKLQVEIGASIEGFRTYADLAKSGYEYESIPPNSVGGIPSFNFVNRVPVGVVVGIVPWNWPLYLTMWKMAPALATGNSVIIKTANETPLTTLALAQLASDAGIPAGVLNILTGDGPSVGEFLVTHPEVNKVSFTGSTAVGKRIMGLASGTLKRLKLELGGKSAQIFLEDADLDLAIDGALFTGYNHAGQTCHNGTRLLVPYKIYDDVLSRLVQRSSVIKVGNPSINPKAGMGPIISKKQLDRINDYIAVGQAEGAKLVTGGTRPHGKEFEKGYWVNPTIFADVNNQMRIAREEIFGPVLTVIPYKDILGALSMANDSPYGLSGNVWGKDLDQAIRVAKQVRTGTVWINDASLVSILAPFGGFKESGFGRESGKFGLLEFTEIQHIHIGLSSQKPYYKSLFTQ
jgi:aldehyde dehydrogenase (NAD+)